MQEHTGLILRLIVIANHRNRMLAHRIPDSIDAGDEDEAGDPLRFELIVERKLRRRQLTEDGNVEITGRDLREKNPPAEQGSLFERAAALSA